MEIPTLLITSWISAAYNITYCPCPIDAILKLTRHPHQLPAVFSRYTPLGIRHVELQTWGGGWRSYGTFAYQISAYKQIATVRITDNRRAVNGVFWCWIIQDL